jgi:hypothetical protein
MKLWFVETLKGHGYDTYDAFVIAAPDATTARKCAAASAADEGAKVWMDESESQCVEIAKRTTCPSGIVLASFNAG